MSLMSLKVAVPRTSFLPTISTTGGHAHSPRIARHGRRVPGVAVTAALPVAPEFGTLCLRPLLVPFSPNGRCFRWLYRGGNAASNIQSLDVGVGTPQLYEDGEDSVFNCYQRAHQNTLENYPAFLVLLLISSFEYPITASVFGTVWVLGRVLYSLGYYSGNPQNRFRGGFNTLGLFGLMITSIVYGVRQVMPLLSA